MPFHSLLHTCADLDEESWATLQVTAWVPLVNTNATNGCMQVVRGAHRSGGTATHACCAGGTWYTEVTPTELEATLGADMGRDVVTCEVPYGSVLLLNNLIPHRSLPNYSRGIRWSLDLRWQRADEVEALTSRTCLYGGVPAKHGDALAYFGNPPPLMSGSRTGSMGSRTRS